MIKDFVIQHKKLSGLIIASILFALIPLFVHSPYYIDLLIIMLLNAMLAMTFIMMLRTGLLSLGVAAFWGIGAYISTVLVMKAGLSFWISLPASAVLTGLLALVIGKILIGSGAGGFSFIMLSSVIGMMFTTAIGNTPFLGGYNGIPKIPPPDPIPIPFLPSIEFVTRIPFFYLALFLFLIVVLISNAFYASRIGRAWNAIGLSPRLASSIGVNINKYRLISFVLASAIAGLIGSFFAHYEGYIVPVNFSMWVNIYVQIYAILGGIGFATLGPVVGSAVMTFFPELFQVTREFSSIFTGILLVLLIMFLPRGLLSLVEWRTAVLKKLTTIFKSGKPSKLN